MIGLYGDKLVYEKLTSTVLSRESSPWIPHIQLNKALL